MAVKVQTIPPKQYWVNRAKDRQIRTVTSEKRLTTGVLSNYKQATKNINKEVKKFFEKNGTVTKSPIFKTVDGIETVVGFNNKRVVNYDKVAQKFGKSKTSRLDRLNKSVAKEVKELNSDMHFAMTDILETNYSDEYYKSIYDIQNGVHLGKSFAILPQTQIHQAIKYPWSGKNYSEIIWTNSAKLTSNLNATLKQGIIQGASIKEMTNRLSKSMNSGYKNAERLIRTEMTYSSNEASFKGYEASGFVDEYEYMSMEDNRTSAKCTGLDGEHFKLDEKVVGVNFPPTHPNCRSTTGVYFPETDTVRLIKDDDGKYYEVPRGTTYNQWKNKTVGKKTTGMSTPAPILGRQANPKWDDYFNKDGTINRPSKDFNTIKSEFHDWYLSEYLSVKGDLYKTDKKQWRMLMTELTDEIGYGREGTNRLYAKHFAELSPTKYVPPIDSLSYTELRELQEELMFRTSGLDFTKSADDIVEEINSKINIELPNFSHKLSEDGSTMYFRLEGAMNHTDVEPRLLEMADDLDNATTFEEFKEALNKYIPVVDDDFDDDVCYIADQMFYDLRRYERNKKQDSFDDIFNTLFNQHDGKMVNKINVMGGEQYVNDLEAWKNDLVYELKWYNKNLHPTIQDGVTKAMNGKINVKLMEDGGRGFYSHNGPLSSINFPSEYNSSTAIHETGHLIHNAMTRDIKSSMGDTVDKFFKARIGNEELSTIYEGTTEVGYKDKFIDHYIGRYYGAGNLSGEEVLSMGFQYIHNSPSSFMEEDLDMFKFIYGVMNGVY